MGSGASVESKPQCPYHQMRQAQVKKAKTSRYVDGEASDFYFHCANGNVDEVRKILEAPVPQPINKLVKLEPNGDTALHVAVEKGHVEIVELLLEHRCSRITLDRFGKVASEVATTPQMQKLFIRSEMSERFLDSNPHKTVSFCIPRASMNKTQKEFVELFETEKEVRDYSLNHQTTAMWVSFYNWFSQKFPRLFRRDNVNIDAFHLDRNNDFHEFLWKKMKDDETYIETLQEFTDAHDGNSIEKLITIYTKEHLGFYKSLNQQLADSPNEAYTSPHLCDRFIIEFHLRGDDLAKRSCTCTVYRGAIAHLSELSLYEQAYEIKRYVCQTSKGKTSKQKSQKKKVEMKNVENEKCRINRKSCLILIMKYLFDFNEKKKKYAYLEGESADTRKII